MVLYSPCPPPPPPLRDPHTLVELSAFSAINRFQPFNVAVSSNVLLLMVRRGGGYGGLLGLTPGGPPNTHDGYDQRGPP